jgi:hypothetical protein
MHAQNALSNLEMPRFTRRYPKLADAVLRQMLTLTKDFEAEYLVAVEEEQKKQREKQQQPQRQRREQEQQEQEEGEDGEPGEAGDGDAEPTSENADGTQQQSLQAR